MQSDFLNFITKLNPKEFGNHLKLYSELYINPVESWKKAYSQGISGYDFIVLHVIYFSTLIFLLVKDFYLTSYLVLIEILLTLIPLIIFIIPFYIFKKLLKFRKKWTHLFRVLLLLKLQFFPLLILLILIAKWSKVEALYLLVDNTVGLIIIFFIIIVPIINPISVFYKLFWITINYLFFLIGVFLIGLGLYFVDTDGNIASKLQIITPNVEYENIWFKNSYFIYRIDDSGYVVILKTIDSSTIFLKKTQLATSELALIIIKNSQNELIRNIIKTDSLQSINDTSLKETKSNKYKLYPVTPLNVNVLDSIGNITNKLLYDDLKLFQHAKDSSVFKSNKEYFELYYQYLKHYEDLITNINITKEIVKTTTPTSSVKIAKDEYVEYYRLTDKYVFQKKKRLLEIKEILDNRESKSNFLSNLIFYPLEKTLDFIGFYD